MDIDPVMIEIAKNEFQIGRFHNIHITESDAFPFMQKCINTFDLIIVDIFILDTIPRIFTESIFLRSLSDHLSPSGKILYNTMIRSMPLGIRKDIFIQLRENNLKVRIIEKVESSNDLIIAER